MGGGKDSGVAGHSTHKACGLIVHYAEEWHSVFHFGGRNPIPFRRRRIVARIRHTERLDQ